MDLKYFEQLIVIDNSKSMRDAAEKLFISQSALSHNLKKIEEEFGCELFDRGRNKLTLNSYGRIVLEHAKKIIQETEEAHRKIEEEKLKYAEKLRIGVFSYAFQSFVLPNVANVLSDYMVESRIQNGAALEEGLKKGVYDIILFKPEPVILPTKFFSISVDSNCLLFSSLSIIFPPNMFYCRIPYSYRRKDFIRRFNIL